MSKCYNQLIINYSRGDFVKKNYFLKISTPLAAFFLAIFIGFSIFNYTVFNLNLHKSLFAKNNIYSYVANIISGTKSNLVKVLNPDMPEKDKSTILSAIDKSTSFETIQVNMDSFVEETLLYIKDERKQLPDIYFESNFASNGPFDKNSITAKKINVGTILSYFNHEEIIRVFSVVKLYYFGLLNAAYCCLFIFLILILVAIFYYADVKYLVFYLFRVCFFTGFTFLFFILIVNLSIKKSVDILFAPIRLSTYYKQEIFTSYFDSLFGNVTLILFLLSLVFGLVAMACFILSKKVSLKYSLPHHRTIATLLIVLTMLSLGFKSYTIADTIESNEYSKTFNFLFLNTPSTQVIPAKDDSIYNLTVEVIDKESSKPLDMISFVVNGIISKNNTYTSFNGITAFDGKFSNKLDKGNYKLFFPKETFPEDFEIPLPYIFELSKTGTTIVTLRLEKKVKETPLKGYVELMIFGKDNKAMENIELTLDAVLPVSTSTTNIITPAPSGSPPTPIKTKTPTLAFEMGVVATPSPVLAFQNNISPSATTTPLIQITPSPVVKLISITNKDGQSVFFVNEGQYILSLKDSSAFKDYEIPKPLDVKILGNTTLKYTIKLSEKKVVKPTNKN